MIFDSECFQKLSEGCPLSFLQTVVFVPSTLILATYLEEQSMRIMPILVITFAAGRMIFALG